MRTALRKLGAESFLVHCAEGESLISHLHDALDLGEIPAFVLLDLRMPRLNGFEALRSIRGHRQLATLPVVVWSSSPMPVDIQLATVLGAWDYIVKPGSYEELCQKIAALLTRFGLSTAKSQSLLTLPISGRSAARP